jgi:hypothetical protein
VVKVLFAGPSLYGTTPDLTGIELRGPAAQGDVATAVLKGANVIGLVDGAFGEVAAVWHKELLFALAAGVRVLGAASMGALRAAECQAFGMEPIGGIAEAYAEGSLDDDAAVAVQHAPAEFGYLPMAEALVDAEATIEHLAKLGLISPAERATLRTTAQNLFFADRTPAAIAAAAGLEETRCAAILAAYVDNRVSVKARDALLLVDVLRAAPDERRAATAAPFTPETSPTWSRLLGELKASLGLPAD